MKQKLTVFLLVVLGLSACATPNATQSQPEESPASQADSDETQKATGGQAASQAAAPGQEDSEPGVPMETDDAAVEGVDDYTATGFDGISQGFGNTFTYPDGFAVTADIVASGQGGEQDYLEKQTRHDCSATDGHWKLVSLKYDNFTGSDFKPNEIWPPSFVNLEGLSSDFTHSTYNPEGYELWSVTDRVEPGTTGTWYDTACSGPDDTHGLLLEPTVTTGESDSNTFRGVLQWAEGGAQFSPPDDYTWPQR